MLRIKTEVKTEPTTAEKVKTTTAALAGLAAEKAAEAKVKAEKDVAPLVIEKTAHAREVLADKAEAAKEAAAPHVEKAQEVAQEKVEAAREAAAPHVEKVADKTADHRANVIDKADVAKAAVAAKLADVAGDAADARKDASKKSKKASKKADKKAQRFAKKADKKGSKMEKKFVKQHGVGARQDVAYKAAAFRGQAQSIAEDKGLTPENVRSMFNDELLPHVKELLATAAAAGTAASHNAVGQLPDSAQQQVARYAPALAPKKKKGGAFIVLGLGALGGAGYLFYADQQKKKAGHQQLSEAAIADSQAQRDDARTINNPVTDFKQADDTTMVHPVGADGAPAAPAGGEGTAATWVDTDGSGTVTSSDLEGETRSSRRQARGDV